MEVPIPNFYFMGIQFIHLFALSIWVGGIVVIRAIVAPVIFQSDSSQERVRRLEGELFRRFNKATLFCAVALISTGLIKFLNWENLTPWNTIRYFAILVMSATSFYLTCKIPPKKGKYLQVLSERGMMINLTCGMTALLMA